MDALLLLAAWMTVESVMLFFRRREDVSQKS